MARAWCPGIEPRAGTAVRGRGAICDTCGRAVRVKPNGTLVPHQRRLRLTQQTVRRPKSTWLGH